MKELYKNSFKLDEQIILRLSNLLTKERINKDFLGRDMAKFLEEPFLLEVEQAKILEEKVDLVNLFNLVNNERTVRSIFNLPLDSKRGKFQINVQIGKYQGEKDKPRKRQKL